MPDVICVPKHFDVEKYVPATLKNKAELFQYPLHLIEWHRVVNKLKRTDFVPLKTEYRRNVMGRRTEKPIMDIWLNAGVIETDNHYIPGSKCKGFRFGEILRDSEFTITPCSDDLSDKIEKMEQKLSNITHLHLQYWLHQTRINYDDAAEVLKQENCPKEDYSSLQLLDNKKFWCVADDYGRLHTNITSLKSSLRPHLRIHNKPIVFIDIVNSQPFFLSVVLANYLNNGGKIMSFHQQANPKTNSNSSKIKNCLTNSNKNNNKAEVNNFNSNSTYTNSNFLQFSRENKGNRDIGNPSTITMAAPIHSAVSNSNSYDFLDLDNSTAGQDNSIILDNRRTLNSQLVARLDYPADVNGYMDLTEQGRLYEKLMEIWNCSRQQAKHQLFAAVLFCKKYDNKYRRAFGEAFPTVLTVIDELKESDYRHAGQMLQRAESAVVIHSACETMRHICPEAPLLTIHDSIGTTEKYLPLLQEVFTAAFKKLGLVPQFKI